MTCNGILAGLVAITCRLYYWVYAIEAGNFSLGAVAGVVVVWGVDLLEYLRIDDPVGAWPVRWLVRRSGTLNVASLATGQPYGASLPERTTRRVPL